MNLSDLPALNACLNGLSAVFLSVGYVLIRQNKQTAHRNCMIGALITSALFLISYVIYHTGMQKVHGSAHTKFVDPAWFRPFYLGILLTHVVLAVAIVPLVLLTVTRAIRQRYELHKKISRWTWPLWMYVSVTGVVIYLILYQIFPQG